ncbi:MAG: hypothetical protein AAGB93_02090 [Planctomycetota bacterium]
MERDGGGWHDGDFVGVEFDWFAHDAAGSVATLSTAGGGFLPPGVARFRDEIEATFAAMAGLAATTRSHDDAEVREDRTGRWPLAVERGFFVYVAHLYGGPYRRIARPIAPIRVDELPAEIARVVRKVSLASASFARAGALGRDELEGIRVASNDA